MKLENVETVTVSEGTKEWLRRIVELDELQGRIHDQVKAGAGSEAAASNIMEQVFETAFTHIHKGILYLLGQNIYENVSDIGSTQI